MHWKYSCPFKSFDRRKLRYRLKWEEGHVFERAIDDHVIRGVPDDFRVLFITSSKEKVVSIIEVKTTTQKKLWVNEKAVAVFQLELYIWLMRPILEKMGYKLHSRHYVEIYSQQDGHLIERIVVPVHSEEQTEKRLRYIFLAWQGLERITYPEEWICQKCPRNVKAECSRWEWIQEQKRLSRFQ